MAGNRNLLQETDVGEIVVYNVKDKDIPIVHRIVRKFGTGEEAQLLTKGDNNAADDTELCRWLADHPSNLTRKLTSRNRCQRTGLPCTERHHRQCCGLHTLCWICDDHALGTPLDEDGDVGDYGPARRLTAGVGGLLNCLFWVWLLSGRPNILGIPQDYQELHIQNPNRNISTWHVSGFPSTSRDGLDGPVGVLG